MHRAFQQWPWLVVVIGVAGAAALTAQSTTGPLTGLRRYLFAPGVAGYFLVGGVHGAASMQTLLLAWSLANGLFWGLVLWGGVRIAQRYL